MITNFVFPALVRARSIDLIVSELIDHLPTLSPAE
jgi:hypothetical protein